MSSKTNPGLALPSELPSELPSVWQTMRRGLQSVPVLADGLALTIGLAIFGALGRLVVPLVIGRAIDQGIDRTVVNGAPTGEIGAGVVDVGLIGRLVAIGLVIVLLTTVAGQWSQYRLNVRAEQALASLRRSSVDRILRLSIQQHGDTRRGVLVARLTSDVETLSQFFSWGAIAWILDGATILVAAIAMLVINVKLGVLAMVLSLPMLLVFRYLQRRLIAAYDVTREYVGDYLARVSEIVGSAHLIRAYGAQSELRTLSRTAIVGRRKASIRAGTLGAILGVSSDVFGAMIVSVSLVVALGMGPGSGLTAGTVVTFMLLVSRYLEPFSELAEVIDQTQLASSGMARILDLIDLPDDVVGHETPLPLSAGRLSVELTDVEFIYPARKDDPGIVAETSSPQVDAADPQADTFALRSINLAITAGETVAIVGATGSGKSTLAKLLVRTADPTSGIVSLSGVPMHRVEPTDLRRRVQLVPQEPFLFDTTIAENVAMAALASSGKELSPSEVDALLVEVGLGDWLASLANGSATVVGERGGLLSAGERQLVALARARAANPDVIVLDEATSSVDAATEARLANTVGALSEGRTTIVIAHRLTTVLRADRVVVMEAGRIVEIGTPDELGSREGGVFANLVSAWERAAAT